MRKAELVHLAATRVLALAMLVIGVALVVQALSSGGAALRVVLGVLFIAAGVGRLYLLHLRAHTGEGERG